MPMAARAAPSRSIRNDRVAREGFRRRAHAAQPYTCDCKDKRKGFVASTQVCEKELHKASGRPLA